MTVVIKKKIFTSSEIGFFKQSDWFAFRFKVLIQLQALSSIIKNDLKR